MNVNVTSIVSLSRMWCQLSSCNIHVKHNRNRRQKLKVSLKLWPEANILSILESVRKKNLCYRKDSLKRSVWRSKRKMGATYFRERVYGFLINWVNCENFFSRIALTPQIFIVIFSICIFLQRTILKVVFISSLILK